MATYLDRILDYDSWANQGLLDFLERMPPETLDLTAAGVYGTIRQTFEHLLSSEMGYTRRLAPPPPRDLPERPEHPDLATLRAMATESAARLVELVDTLPEPSTRIETSSGMRAAATILTQLVMHGVEHRGHIGTILGANGIEPPDLDSWAHGIWVHGDDWPPDWGADRRG